MDFDSARIKVISENCATCSGIGSLSERLIHKILKYTVEPDDSYHEIKYKGLVADVKREDEIYEIQTRGFERLSDKLDAFLSECKVTVIHPIIAEKQIFRFDKATGEITGPRKSPSPKTVFDSAYEIFKLRRFLFNPDFEIKLFLLSVDEYKNVERKKRYGPTDLIERIPKRLLDVVTLSCVKDYYAFIPPGLPVEFTSADYVKCARSRSRYCYYGVRLLSELGIVKKIGKRGRAYLFSLA